MQNSKGKVYVIGLLLNLLSYYKEYVFVQTAHKNVQLYMELHFWILFKDIISIFFRVSIVSILINMEFEWT